MLAPERAALLGVVEELREVLRPFQDVPEAQRDRLKRALETVLLLVEQQPGEGKGVTVLGGKVFASILGDERAPDRARLLSAWFDLEAPMLVCLDFARAALFTRNRPEATAHLREVWTYVRRLASLVEAAPAALVDAEVPGA